MISQVKSSARVHNVDADPYKVLAAALLQYTVYDAVDFTPRNHQSKVFRDRRRKEAQHFFTSRRCHGWLDLVRPEGVDIEMMQEMFLRQINAELARFNKPGLRVDLDGTLELEGIPDARSQSPEEGRQEAASALP